MNTRSRRDRRARRLAVVVSVLTAACGGEHKTPATDTGTSQPAAGATAAATALAAPVPGTPPTGATAQMATLGDSIFHGQAAGGLCFTCHGADARGTTLAPPLLDHKWLTGDGSYAFIQQRVTTGMPKQTPPYPGPMLPMGGAQLTPDQIKAVAAYVYSISHPAS